MSDFRGNGSIENYSKVVEQPYFKNQENPVNIISVELAIPDMEILNFLFHMAILAIKYLLMKKITLLKINRDEIYSQLYVFNTTIRNIQPNSVEINLPIPFGLTRFGFDQKLQTEKEHLEAIKNKPFDYKGVQRAQAFAMDILSKSEKINKKHSSYGLKHIAERFFERHFGRFGNSYVANGDFILALYLSEYKILVESNNSPNCYFNISETSIENAERHSYAISENMKKRFQEEGIYDVF